ncbi:MAG: fructose-bisphosphate aldolase class I [Verrucomicrobiae bacterium]|nr:fructose-bisphosphate aldolase class I [Verrucomicrobiae bacterium]
MNRSALEEVAHTLGARGKGILAADESTPTISKRLAAVGVESSPEINNAYRDVLLTAPGLERSISGVIFFEETLRQATIGRAVPYPDHLKALGIIPGIKVDKGAKMLAGSSREKVTEGLDGLRERFATYNELGARFAKWRAVIAIEGDAIPSRNALQVNAHALARYAALAQEAGLVPICEPEVLMDGTHSIARAFEVTEAAIKSVYLALHEQGVLLEGTVLKPNMVMSGYDGSEKAGTDEVAAKTLECLKRCVPAAVPSIVFLSGGQTEIEATTHLNRINEMKDAACPWNLSFSFGRALQQTALSTWAGDSSRIPDAQRALLHRARCSGLATTGEYSESVEAGGATAS